MRYSIYYKSKLLPFVIDEETTMTCFIYLFLFIYLFIYLFILLHLGVTYIKNIEDNYKTRQGHRNSKNQLLWAQIRASEVMIPPNLLLLFSYFHFFERKEWMNFE